MAGSNLGGMEGGYGGASHPPIRQNPDGSVNYDSSREGEARGRNVEQNMVAPFDPIPGTRDRMVSVPNPIDDAHIQGSGDDLLTPTCIRPDADDCAGACNYS